MYVSKCYYIWITYLLNIYPNDNETRKINLLNETHGKEMRCWPFKTVRIKRSIIKLSYFKQYLYYVAIFGTNYQKKMQLDTNYSLVSVGFVGMGDVRKSYLSRAGALPGNSYFHQNTIAIIFFTVIINLAF